jgi:hypothetical protein
LHYLAVPIEELCRRLESRNEEGTWGTVAITREMLEEYAKDFEAPDRHELDLFDAPPADRCA